MESQWIYINGSNATPSSVQISPDGKTLLVKESTKNTEGETISYRLIDLEKDGE